MAKRRVLISLIALVLAGSIGLWWSSRPRFEVRNILLISIDTCRADRLGCYGYPHNTTPHIDALAEQSILFTDTVAAVPMTLPSHTTILTGTNPPYHGIHDNYGNRLADSNVTLAEILRDNGFTTGAIVSTFVMDSKFGMDQGFDTYNDQFETSYNVQFLTERRGDEATREAIGWLDQHQDERFFLFLHYFDPHDPYEPPEPFALRFKDNLYAGEIAYTDHCIGQVIDKLKGLGLYDSTLIILTSDHGEMLGEHGEPTHAYFIYQGVLHVPLIFKVPGETKSHRVDDPVGLTDIVPTVCSMLGIQIPPEARGEDLSIAFRGGKLPRQERYRYCESVTPTHFQANSLLGVVGRQWKFIQTTRPELYDLGADPEESNNLVKEMPSIAQRMEAQLHRILEEELREDVDAQIDLDAETLRRLESIGYVGGKTRAGRMEYYDRRDDLDDPKDLIAFRNEFLRAATYHARKELDKARRICLQLVELRPKFLRGHIRLAKIAMDQADSAMAQHHLNRALCLDPDEWEANELLGNVLLAEKKYEAAIPHLERVIQFDPTRPKGFRNLGAALAAVGRTDEAIEHYRIVLELAPDFPGGHGKLAWALADAGMTEQAIGHYVKALEVDPDNTHLHFYLARAYEAQRKTDQAIQQYEKTLELDGDHAGAHLNLGALLGQKRQLDQSVHHFREALRIQPDYALAHYNLARALQSQGQLDEAMPHYQLAVDLDPDDARAHYRCAQALVVKGQAEEALAHYRQALKLRSDWTAVLSEMAWCLAARPDWPVHAPEEALALARRAAELSNQQDAKVLQTLALAQAAAGQLEAAVATARKALALATAADDQKTAAQIRQHLELYEQGKPFPDR